MKYFIPKVLTAARIFRNLKFILMDRIVRWSKHVIQMLPDLNSRADGQLRSAEFCDFRIFYILFVRVFIIIKRNIYAGLLWCLNSCRSFFKIFKIFMKWLFITVWFWRCNSVSPILFSVAELPLSPCPFLLSILPPWQALRYYRPHLQVRDPIWGLDWSHSLQRRSPNWAFTGFFSAVR